MIVDDFTFEQTRAILIQALAALAEEPKLFDFKINERTLTQRLSLYLQPRFGTKLSVDCEYNRMWEETDVKKELPWGSEQVWSDDCEGRTVYPDIIIHVRGRLFENLLVIEAKRNHSKDFLPEIDEKKLKRFTHPEGDFRYRWGAFLNFVINEAPKHVAVTWFEQSNLKAAYDEIGLK